MMTPADIIEAAEKHVVAYLSSTGYHCHASRAHHGVTDIEATGQEENLFVIVKAALGSNPVPDATTAESGHAVSRAMTLGFDAWLAKVHVGNSAELLGDIEWLQLNH